MDGQPESGIARIITGRGHIQILMIITSTGVVPNPGFPISRNPISTILMETLQSSSGLREAYLC